VDGFVAFILARPRWVIACVLVVTGLFARELRFLEPRVSLRDLTPRGHAYRAIDDALREDFGVGQTALLAIGVEQGDVFTPGTLARIARLTSAVEALPGVEPDSVLSLASPLAREVSSGPDGVRIGPLMDGVPADPQALRAAVFAQPAYVGLLVTKDGRGAMIQADFGETERPERVTRALDALAAAERAQAPRCWWVGNLPPSPPSRTRPGASCRSSASRSGSWPSSTTRPSGRSRRSSCRS
jgi:hypothetical protein